MNGPDGIRFEIADTGIGIAPDRLTSLFDAFTQGSTEIAQTYGGTGLGLKISRHLCRLMRGDLSVTSEVDHGSTFVVELPVSVCQSSFLRR